MSDLEHYKAVEARARRKVGDGVLHPDGCPKLTLHGADFAVPPRGGRVVATFTPRGVGVTAIEADDWPEADRFLRLARTRQQDVCQTCGGSCGGGLRADARSDGEFLAAAFELAGRLLDKQYELTDEQKAELLSFGTRAAPQWIPQLLRWCRGLPTTRHVPCPAAEPARFGDTAGGMTGTGEVRLLRFLLASWPEKLRMLLVDAELRNRLCIPAEVEAMIQPGRGGVAARVDRVRPEGPTGGDRAAAVGGRSPSAAVRDDNQAGIGTERSVGTGREDPLSGQASPDRLHEEAPSTPASRRRRRYLQDAQGRPLRSVPAQTPQECAATDLVRGGSGAWSA